MGEGPELVGEAQVVADEHAHAQAADVGGQEVVAGGVVLVLAGVAERVDLGVALDAGRPGGRRRRCCGTGRRRRAGRSTRRGRRRARPRWSSRNCSFGPPSSSAMRSGRIENPVANISLSTISPAPSAAASAIIGRTELAGAVRVLPDDVVLDRRRLSSGGLPQPAHGVLEHRRPLAEREPDVVVAGVGVVEDAARDRDHAGAARAARGRTSTRVAARRRRWRSRSPAAGSRPDPEPASPSQSRSRCACRACARREVLGARPAPAATAGWNGAPLT